MGKGGKREGVTERARACALLAICYIELNCYCAF